MPTDPDVMVHAMEDEGSAGTPITIVIADDHQVVRAGLRLLLEAEDGFEVVAEAGDVPTTERRLAAYPPRGRASLGRRTARRPERTRGRGAEADRARAHQRRDRPDAVPQRAHGRITPGPHPAEDSPHHARRAGRVRARTPAPIDVLSCS